MSEEISRCVLHGHSERAASLPLPFSTKITLDRSRERTRKGVKLCMLQGEAGHGEVNKAATESILAYFYERHGKRSVLNYVLPSRGSLSLSGLLVCKVGGRGGWDGGGEGIPGGRARWSIVHRRKY